MSLSVEHLGIVGYDAALALQEHYRDGLLNGGGPPALLLLQHPPTITTGSLTEPDDLLLEPERYEKRGILVVPTNRGGRATYHGPGQLVGYPILNLRSLAADSGMPSVRSYLRGLEEVLIRVLKELGIEACRQENATGAWVQDRKIASIGVAVRRWVTLHGFALNVDMDLAPFETIRPCGFSPDVMTSIARETGNAPSMAELEEKIIRVFAHVFGLDIADGQHKGGSASGQ